MKRLSPVLPLLLLFAAAAEAVDLTQVPGTIAKEPAYQSQPKYCLLVFGPEAATRVWLVHDGDTLYVDRNANGDLTEADERISPDESSKVGEGTLVFNVGDIVDGDVVHKSLMVGTGPNVPGVVPSDPHIAAVLAKDPATRLYLIQVDVEMPGRRGTGIGGRVHQGVLAFDTNGVLQFADAPEKAPLIHFGGDWRITLFGHAELIIGRQKDVFLGLGTPGIGPGTTAFVAYQNLVPTGVCPRLDVTLPAEDGTAMKEQYLLTERCCTYNFHGGVRVPDDVSPGEAVVTITFDDWIGGFVAPTTHRVPVVAPRIKLTLEPVSPRLKASLIHPVRDASLGSLLYSPDGGKIIAGDYPGGMIEIWDAASGDELMRIDTATDGHSSFEYFHVSPEWTSGYAVCPQRTVTRVEREGKILRRWEFDGEVREWDLASGELRRVFQHTPPRNIKMMVLSPDGRYFLTGDELPGEYEGAPPRSVSLWDVESGTSRDLGPGSGFGVFSPDSRRVAVEEMSVDFEATAVHVLDTARGARELTIPVDFPSGHVYRQVLLMGFSPDGKTLIGRTISFAKKGDLSTRESFLKFWDATSGEEVTAISANRGEIFSWPAVFSPDGRSLVLTNWQGELPELYVIDLARKEIANIIRLRNEKAFTQAPAFSPDGRWITVMTRVLPENFPRNGTAEDVPQPRIHFVDAKTGEIVETMITPQCFSTSLTFSPDGKTLASSGHGRVLLWDLSTPPGQLATK